MAFHPCRNGGAIEVDDAAGIEKCSAENHVFSLKRHSLMSGEVPHADYVEQK